MGKRGWTRLGTLAVLLAVVGGGRNRGETPRVAAAPGSAAYRGAGSCSAAACHGRSQPDATKILRNEHATWITRDRHADAFEVLYGERSRAIAAALSGGRTPAHEDSRCLACHATPGPSPGPDGTRPGALTSEGVSCESCHGPAGRWIGEHTRWDWAGRSPEEKERFGMVATASLTRRARVCAGCHVGEPAGEGRPAREVDHDMIAAGHPRLDFEFSAFLATMPHHWRDDAGSDSAADFPARAWAVGQLVSAQATLELLHDRAERAAVGGGRGRAAAWPEFSEYGCFSCHHELRDDPWKRSGPDRPGAPRWASWHLALIGALEPPQAAADGIAGLTRLMEAPRPDPAEVARRSSAVASELRRWLASTGEPRFDAPRVGSLLSSLTSLPERGRITSWDQATQRYLALVPLTQALRTLEPGRARPEQTAELTRLRDFLKFPQGYDSPSRWHPAGARPIR